MEQGNDANIVNAMGLKDLVRAQEEVNLLERERLLKLAAPFDPKEIDWRIGQAGAKKDGAPWAKVLAYIDARAVMDRLDDVVGPGNWKDRYWREGNGVMCGLAIRVSGEWVEKIDGSDETDIEAFKGGISKAMVRTAVKWGIGRYLYNLGESWANIVADRTPGARWQPGKQGSYPPFNWLPPELPAWALPEKVAAAGKPSGGSAEYSARAAATANSVKGRLANDGPKQAAGRDQGQAGQPASGGASQGPSVQGGIDAFFDEALQGAQEAQRHGGRTPVPQPEPGSGESVRGVRSPGGNSSVPAANPGRSGSGDADTRQGGAPGVQRPVAQAAGIARSAPKAASPGQGPQDAGRAVGNNPERGRGQPAGLPGGANRPGQQDDGGAGIVATISAELEACVSPLALANSWKAWQPKIRGMGPDAKAYLETVKNKAKEKLQ